MHTTLSLPPYRWRCSHTRAYTFPAATGLFLLSQALDGVQALEVAHQAFWHYSGAQHTNISNLRRMKNQEEALIDKSMQATEIRPSCGHEWVENDDVVVMETETFEQKYKEKLTWSSLGYMYQWSDRQYSHEPSKRAPFPPRLSILIDSIARSVGCNIVAEAALVNFYAIDGFMGCHRDDAEYTLTKPIVSISLGQSALFLIASSKTEEPLCLVLHHGDVLIMSHESRCFWHGVPRIVQTSHFRVPDVNTLPFQSTQEQIQQLCAYLNRSRININVRQVENDQRDVHNPTAE